MAPKKKSKKPAAKPDAADAGKGNPFLKYLKKKKATKKSK